MRNSLVKAFSVLNDRKVSYSNSTNLFTILPTIQIISQPSQIISSQSTTQPSLVTTQPFTQSSQITTVPFTSSQIPCTSSQIITQPSHTVSSQIITQPSHTVSSQIITQPSHKGSMISVLVEYSYAKPMNSSNATDFNIAQQMLSIQFPSINGVNSTLCQETDKRNQPFPTNWLQIILQG